MFIYNKSCRFEYMFYKICQIDLMLKDKIFGNLKKVGQGTTCQVYNIGSCALKVINHT